eukprot:CAMPEP_0197033906 /NCGR_PEP_ID=MMETSP1384-20130603/12178_1 /TAXON_ID=29189 /ORGANISM="Ammonia sp." /LENGTH=514 /DNA_ID=CAMNT_0042463769 /DNA_START=56 /DNA_END=1601 /DNA_ORIENTATION=+
MTTIIVISCVSLLFHICESNRATIEHANAPTPFLAVVSEYSQSIATSEQPLTGNIVFHPSDSKGCTAWPSSQNKQPGAVTIGMVDRGQCTFLEKTKHAQLSNLDMLFIASDDDSLTPMGADEAELQALIASQNNQQPLLTIMVPQSFKTFVEENEANASNLSIKTYKPMIYDSGMLVMIGVATVLVGIGAYYSSDTERAKMYSLNSDRSGFRRRAPIQVIDHQMAWSFILVASVGLLTLYFFVSKIFMIVVFVFCVGATNGLSTIFAHAIDHFIPHLQLTEYFIPSIDLECTLSDIIGFIPALMISVVWFITRQEEYAWILQNVMCVGLLLVLQRTIRLTNIRIASILLGTAFFYDIFWVFLSPLFFQSSVMVSVATYHHAGNTRDTLPVVLKIPRIDDIFHSPMILGLGDIALPGLLVSYLLRYDYLSKVGISVNNGYFVPSLIGYAIGMLLTDINLILMQHGQPALLFLVPCTLGTTLVLAYRRGHEAVCGTEMLALQKRAKTLSAAELQLI